MTDCYFCRKLIPREEVPTKYRDKENFLFFHPECMYAYNYYNNHEFRTKMKKELGCLAKPFSDGLE